MFEVMAGLIGVAAAVLAAGVLWRVVARVLR